MAKRPCPGQIQIHVLIDLEARQGTATLRVGTSRTVSFALVDSVELMSLVETILRYWRQQIVGPRMAEIPGLIQ